MAKKITHIPATRKIRSGGTTANKKIRVAAYCRVSSEQDEQLNSFENQVTYYTNYINSTPDYEMAGIYADEGISGTSTRKREDFNRMIADCERGLIDLIIVKSISRFARNTQDCLFYSRKLKEMGIGITFEKEAISTLDNTGELLFTILSSLAQDESRSISENCQWGIRSQMQRGIHKINTKRFYGFDSDDKGKLIVNEEQAKVVRWIFEAYLNGINPDVIARKLNEEKVEQCMGGYNWKVTQVMQILENEKHNGDSILQKTFIPDYLTHKSVPNTGQLPQYHIKDDHEGIVSKEIWEAAQLEIQRRRAYMHSHSMITLGQNTDKIPFTHKIICGCCNHNYARRKHTRSWGRVYLWQCGHRYLKKGVIGCRAPSVYETDAEAAFLTAWNYIVQNRTTFLSDWKKKMEQGNALEKLRAEQFMELSKSGERSTIESSFVNKVLDHMIYYEGNRMEIRFLDGINISVDLNKNKGKLL